jgi:fatty acyl-CoA reductase
MGQPQQIAATASPLYSISNHFHAGCNVLLTGASGYIGSLVVEKLLRDTKVARIYVLLRSRRGVSPADRVAKLLQGPLFHLLDDKQAARVTAVAGDILEPGLGLSPEDEAMLVENIDTVIHSAAGGWMTALPCCSLSVPSNAASHAAAAASA